MCIVSCLSASPESVCGSGGLQPGAALVVVCLAVVSDSEEETVPAKKAQATNKTYCNDPPPVLSPSKSAFDLKRNCADEQKEECDYEDEEEVFL